MTLPVSVQALSSFLVSAVACVFQRWAQGDLHDEGRFL